MSEENKARTLAFMEEVLNKKNVGALDDFFAADYVEHSESPPGIPANREGMKQMMGMFFAGFPDLQVTTEEVIAEGDKVVVRNTVRGTHQGEFMGIPATGKQIEISEIHIVRIVDGMVVEHWGITDQMGMMQQLGLIPTG